MIPVQFGICCDFECLNARVEESLETSKTQKTYRQNPIAPGYYFISDLPNILWTEHHECFGENTVKWFVGKMIKLETQKNNTLTKQNLLKKWLKRMKINSIKLLSVG